MAYEGELLTSCPARMFSFGKTSAVVVSGARMNPYGHMLLNTGGPGGSYFQVSDLYGDPRFMNEAQFQRYLKENKKIIVTVLPIVIPSPQKAQLKLEQLLSRKWAGGLSYTTASHWWRRLLKQAAAPGFIAVCFPCQ